MVNSTFQYIGDDKIVADYNATYVDTVLAANFTAQAVEIPNISPDVDLNLQAFSRQTFHSFNLIVKGWIAQVVDQPFDQLAGYAKAVFTPSPITATKKMTFGSFNFGDCVVHNGEESFPMSLTTLSQGNIASSITVFRNMGSFPEPIVVEGDCQIALLLTFRVIGYRSAPIGRSIE